MQEENLILDEQEEQTTIDEFVRVLGLASE